MSLEREVDQVALDELLARFVMFRDWVRSDQTIKQDAFFPPKDLHLSVTRHLQLSEQELWSVGELAVEARSSIRSKSLVGRADVIARIVSQHGLRTEAAPEPSNPNHADVIGWPTEKAAQKMIATELAREANFIAKSPGTS